MIDADISLIILSALDGGPRWQTPSVIAERAGMTVREILPALEAMWSRCDLDRRTHRVRGDEYSLGRLPFED